MQGCTTLIFKHRWPLTLVLWPWPWRVCLCQLSACINASILKMGKNNSLSRTVVHHHNTRHYCLLGQSFMSCLKLCCVLLQACRTPMRTTTGLQLLFEYYNQLYFVEKRFVPPNTSIGLYFEWYVSVRCDKCMYLCCDRCMCLCAVICACIYVLW